MTPVTRYAYEQRIRELKARLVVVEAHLYQAHTCCDEIYTALIEQTRKGQGISVAWLLERLKRLWMKL